MPEKILFLDGDGIGPSVLRSAERVIQAATDSVEIVHGEIGIKAFDRTGQYLPHETLDLMDECKVIMCGPIFESENKDDPLNTLMVQLDLFTRVRHYITLAPDVGVPDMDVLIWGCNNNIAAEFSEIEDLDGFTLKKYVKNNAYSRMMGLAKKDIEARGLERISCLVRDDFFPKSSSIFKDSFESMFPSDSYKTNIYNVKDWVARAHKFPTQDQCILCVDLYHQIVAGVLGGLTGYDHLAPLYFAGDEYTMYKPCNRAEYGDTIQEGYENPTAGILCAATAFRNMGMPDKSAAIVTALKEAYAANERTPDVGGDLTGADFTDRIIDRL